MKWIAEHKIGIWAFAVAVAFIPGIMSEAFLPRWAVIAIGAPLVSRLTLERLSQAMQYTLVLGVAWAACTVLVSPDRGAGALQLFFIMAMVGAFLAASEMETLDDAMTGLALGVGVSSIVSLLWLASVGPVDQGTALYPAGLFYNSEVLAEFTAPIFLWTLLRKRWPLVLITIVPLIVCHSRAALLAVALGAIWFYRPRSKALMAILLSCWAIAGAAACLFLFDRFTPAGTRIVIWLATLLAATPLGNGLGWFEAAHPVEQFAHSDAIQAINELGIGALFLAAIPVLILRSNRGTNAERAVFITVCIQVAVSFPLHVPGAAFVAAIVAGYLAGSRAHILLRRSDGRARNEQDNQRYSAIGGSVSGGSGLGRGALSVRSAPASYAALGVS